MPEVLTLNSIQEEEVPPSKHEKAMGFLDHLDELRRRVFYVAIFIFISFVACWGFSKSLYNFLSKPVAQALQNSKLRNISTNTNLLDLGNLADGTPVTFIFDSSASIHGATIPAGTTVPARVIKNSDGKNSLVTIQNLIIKGLVIPEGFQLPSVISNNTDPSGQLVVHTVQGAFNLYVKVAFYGAIFLSVPFILYQLYAFIAPGLYKHERNYVWPVIGMGTFFFLLGSSFGYYVAFPRACQFLIGEAENFQTYIEVNEYFDLIMTIVLGLGLVFEIPTIVFFLARLGLVTARFLFKAWKIAILGIFLVAAIISPTSDIPNMMVFALPMLALYYFSILIAYLCGRARKKAALSSI